MAKKKVVVGMSGGVDSSTAAYLLKKKGYEVVGLFMRTGIHAEGPRRRGCCSVEDAHDARRVAEHLGIRFYVLNFEKEFEEIIAYFCSEYARGRTPNPCILCNERLKFGKLFEFARTLGAEKVATGHYARVRSDGRFQLLKGLDPDKDQSYVLFSLSQEQLAHAVFPVGEFLKKEVRSLAAEAGLRVKDKPDSQEICFVPDDDYANLVSARSPKKIPPGEIVDTEGKVLGYHEGIHHFTVGQRRGLALALGEPKYVIRIEPESNRVVIGSAKDLLAREFAVTKLNWIAIERLTEPIECLVKVRSMAKEVEAVLYPEAPDRVVVELIGPLPGAVTPGQAAVFYDGETVLGGGWIEKRIS